MYDLREQRIDDRGQRAEGRGQRIEGRGQRTELARPLAADARRAMTLIELLVVISIMLMLAAYALPKLAPMAKQRKIREAARSVNVFLSRARSRAIETGRPCGVVFKRVENTVGSPLTNASTMLYQAEVPPPYAGDTLDTKITNLTPGGGIITGTVTPSLNTQLVNPGDLIQIGGQGPWYKIQNVAPLTMEVPLKYQNSIPPWPAGAELPFKILRQPVRTIAQPLSLPVGTAVDLSMSGTDEFIDTDSDGILDSPIFAVGTGDVKIIFSPNGSVNRYYCDYGDADATEPIFLLIGWREQVDSPELVPMSNFDPDDGAPEVDEEKLPNWQLLSNLWITLNPQTGLTSVSENAYAEEAYANAQKGPPASPFSWNTQGGEAWKRAAIRESRSFARRAQSKGGR